MKLLQWKSNSLPLKRKYCDFNRGWLKCASLDTV